MRRDATATVPTARSLELPIKAYTSGGTKLESSRRNGRWKIRWYKEKNKMDDDNKDSNYKKEKNDDEEAEVRKRKWRKDKENTIE